MVYKFKSGLGHEPYYWECVRYLPVESDEHIGISSLTNIRVQPRKDSAACHHLLNWNYSPTFEDFSVSQKQEVPFRTERKSSYNEINQSICSVPCYLFEWILVTFVPLSELPWSVF